MIYENVFFHDTQLKLEEVEAGKLSRKVRAQGGSLMIVEAIFKEGTIGYAHEHHHEQIVYCLAGEFLFTLGTESRTMVAGDSVYVPSGASHGAVCVKEGALLDVFTPQREDLKPQVASV